jgi:hypothetical protein
VNTSSIRVRVALRKARESGEIAREVVEASLAIAKAAQAAKLAGLEAAVGK